MGFFSFCVFPTSCHGQIVNDNSCEVRLKNASNVPLETHLVRVEVPSKAELPLNEAGSSASRDSNSPIQSPQSAPSEQDPNKALFEKKTSFSTLTAWQILAYNVVNSSELAAIPEESEHIDLTPPPAPPLPSLQSSSVDDWSADKVELLEQLGFGAFGKVFKARRRSDGALACVKIINVPGASAVTDEISTLRALRHPHIVRLYGAYCDNEQHAAIAMELCSGGDLEKWLKLRGPLRTTTGPNSRPLPHQNHHYHLSEAEIMHCFVQVLIALQYVHSHGILHRDIKTSNIFLSFSKSTSPLDANNDNSSAINSIFDYTLKLGDFGIAKSLEPGESCARTMVGTPCFFSPELISDQPYNNKSDVWAAGCVLYELCSLQRPFQGNSVSAVCVKILAAAAPSLPATCSPELVKLVELLLTKDPRKRPSINAVLENSFVQKYYEKYKKWRRDHGLGSIEEESQLPVDFDLGEFAEKREQSLTTLKEENSTSQVEDLDAVTVIQRNVAPNKVCNTNSRGRGDGGNRRQAEGECREELIDDEPVDEEVQYVFAS